jgi:GWxTD domain-containing protein
MKLEKKIIKISVLIVSLILTACAFFFKTMPEPTPKKQALDLIWHISTADQRKTLKALDGEIQIMEFMADFWKRLDPTPQTPENEFKDEYLTRFEYVKKRYPIRRARGRADKARVYLLYGAPVEILYYPIYDTELDKFTRMVSAEIWIYDEPASKIETPNLFSEIYPYNTKFIFADMTGDGLKAQIYSTVIGEKIDPRVFRTQK